MNDFKKYIEGNQENEVFILDVNYAGNTINGNSFYNVTMLYFGIVIKAKTQKNSEVNYRIKQFINQFATIKYKYTKTLNMIITDIK